MPRGQPKKNEKRAQKTTPNSVSLISGVFAAIGKPFFIALYNFAYFIVFLISLLGKATRIAIISTFDLLSDFIIRAGKQLKSKKPVKIKKQASEFIKIEKLRINLYELTLISKIKKLFGKFTKTKRRKRIVKLGFIIPLFTLLAFLGFLYFSVLKDLPSPTELSLREPEVSTKIYDRNGVLLYKIFDDKNRTIVPLVDIPIHVRLATLAAEDAEFYNHPGFSIKGILRALTQDFRSGTLQGGSTITQQLVKNVLLTPEKTLIRKLREIILSIQVETRYTKDQILEMYLNEVSYGGTAYGIEEASLSYFGKEVKDLTIAEAAFLAGLPKSPTTYSPFGQNSDLAFERQKEVLKLMRINKFITPETENQAVNEKLSFIPNKKEILAPHFVMYVRQILVDRYGEDVVEKGGLEVTTSLDIKIQKMAEEVVSSEIEKLKNLNVGNAAALVMNPKNGEILSMVGSTNYFDTERGGQVNVLLRLRQPGSAIKLVNYAYALSQNYSPATMIDDSPITYVIPGSKPYSPVNYDGQFVGNISLRNAFAGSRNIPAVKVLASYGVSKMVEQGKKMGITTWEDSSNYGLSLTLGGGAVKGIDLASVFATVANEGVRTEPVPILSVKNYKGKILEEADPKTEKVLDPRVSFILTDILKDNMARSQEFGLHSYLVIKDHPEVAVKTGTSNDLRDNWTVGYNQNFLTLTWVGNNDNSPMGRIASGVTGASPIWNKIMTSILANVPSEDWTPPLGLSKIQICQNSGYLPCNGCPLKYEWFLEENKPKKQCSPQTPSPTPEVDGGKKKRPGRIL